MGVASDDLLIVEERESAAERSPAGRRAHAVQRVQVGLIGLAAMILLVGLASIIISNARRNQAEVVPEAAPTVAPQQTATPVSDPLADVGVLPDLPHVPDLPVEMGDGEDAGGAVVDPGDAPPLPTVR